ncbi:MAG TPA: cysteine dioxygenase family protein [Thermoanaerobaculia bacterium]|jgi:cysteine dioxygenase
MAKTFAELLRRLDAFSDRIPLGELDAALSDVSISLDDVRPWLIFGADTYRRNLVHAGPAYQALVLCWRNGQRSPIHDHSGSSCGVRVLSGEALETVFERTRTGMVFAVRSLAHAPGSVCATQDTDIHQVSSVADDGGDLVTLHVYSPPLLNMGTYTLFDANVRAFHEPVHEDALVDGGGI